MKKVSKMFSVLLCFGCLCFVVLAFIRYYQGIFSIWNFFQVVFFFGGCFVIAAFDFFGKLEFKPNEENGNWKLLFLSALACVVSGLVILLQGAPWKTVAGVLGLIFFGLVFLKFFLKRIKK